MELPCKRRYWKEDEGLARRLKITGSEKLENYCPYRTEITM
jgi:hypothetical protein